MSEINKINRRDFLKRTGQASGGLVFALTFTSACGPSDVGSTATELASVAPNVYVNIRNDGVVEIFCHRSEMGQGIRTSLPQVIADELEADWDKIKLIQSIGDEKYGDQNTDGSTSIRKQFDLLRNAGATAREMLVTAAAAMWGVPGDECVAREHAVHHEDSGRSAGYGELVDAASQLEPPTNAPFKSAADYRYIGKPMDTIDGRAFTTGTAMYGTDTVLPDMVYAAIEHCPASGGTVVAVDDAAARAMHGVIDVIKLPAPTVPPVFNIQGGVAVIGDNTWSAQKGREALNIEWDRGANGDYESVEYREKLIAAASEPGRVALTRGDVAAAASAAASTHEAIYYAPHLAHAPMEPPATVARMTDAGGCEVWTCTQNSQATQQTVAATLGLEKQQVRVNVTLLGGAFGRKSKPDYAAEAAWLARATGRPVKVTWTREDDLRHGYLHAVSAQYFKAGFDENKKTVSWLQRTAFPSIGATFNPAAAGPGDFELGLGATDNPYDIPNLQIEACDAKAHLRIGWLRSVCNIFHAYGASSFADELAHIAGADPKDHLLQLIGPDRKIDPNSEGAAYSNYDQPLAQHPIDTARLKAVAEKAASMADWDRSLAAGHGLGIAVHRSFLTYVATVAEVSVNDSGKLVVHELWTAVDAGLVVNPDRVTSQMEGAGIFGMSLALHGEITTAEGAVVQGNYDTYPVVRMHEAPTEVNVHIMDSDALPGGVGEPGVPPVAPAITNAYFAASGIRIRELPLRNAGLA